MPAQSGGHGTRQRVIAILLGLFVGLVVYQGYEWLRFPPGFEREAIKYNPPIWNPTPLAAAVALIISPSCGAIWYCPPVLLGCGGLMRSWREDRLWASSVLLACIGFFATICMFAFFKGNIAWGPRYLTPVFAVLWLFTPPIVSRARSVNVAILLALGFVVQLLALSTDPHRVYIVNNARPDALFVSSELYYHLPTSHLFARPAEIVEVLTSDAVPTEASPAPSPTYALPPPGSELIEQSVARRYAVFADFRPWWCWQRHLPPEDRPVDLIATAELLLTVAAIGAALTICTWKPRSLT
jgi:hypothetical protein